LRTVLLQAAVLAENSAAGRRWAPDDGGLRAVVGERCEPTEMVRAA